MNWSTVPNSAGPIAATIGLLSFGVMGKYFSRETSNKLLYLAVGRELALGALAIGTKRLLDLSSLLANGKMMPTDQIHGMGSSVVDHSVAEFHAAWVIGIISNKMMICFRDLSVAVVFALVIMAIHLYCTKNSEVRGTGSLTGFHYFLTIGVANFVGFALLVTSESVTR